MAHAWWHPDWVPPYGGGPQLGEEEYYAQTGQPDIMAAMEWARTQAEQEGREPSLQDILAYWSTQDPSATPAGAAQMYRERQSGADELPEYGPSGQEEVFPPPVTPGVEAAIKGPVKKDKEDDIYSQLFLASLMEEMGGGKVGQAPGVVTGGGFGGLPSMMGQFRRQQKPWWIV